jgi:hypothetical protein
MWDQVGQLYAYHGDVPAEVRLLKLTEEVGEVADAFIGMRGLNARKGDLPNLSGAWPQLPSGPGSDLHARAGATPRSYLGMTDPGGRQRRRNLSP